jgi:hypothetical protein
VSPGRLQKVAAALVAASALAAGTASAGEPDSAAERNATAGATMKAPNGWSASLFVSSFGPRQTVEDNAAQVKSSSFVNARLSRNLSKQTRLSVDVFNIFDHRLGNVDYFSTTRVWAQPGAGDNFLFNPAEPRGFRVKLRTTF